MKGCLKISKGFNCNRCGVFKDEGEFNWRYKALGVRQRTCRDCQREQKRSWYDKHGDKHRARVRENNKGMRD